MTRILGIARCQMRLLVRSPLFLAAARNSNAACVPADSRNAGGMESQARVSLDSVVSPRAQGHNDEDSCYEDGGHKHYRHYSPCQYDKGRRGQEH